MAWVRFDDTFPEHPKVLKVGGDAAWLHVCALAYCNRLETDGVIPTGVVGRLSDRKDAKRLAAKLVSEGLWDVHPEGWEIHDYHDFQPSKAELEQRREARAQAGRKGGVKSGETRRERSKPEANSEANASGLLEANSERSGTPSRPVPSRPDVSNSVVVLQSVPGTVDDDDVIIDRIIERCATIRTERARPANSVAYRATVLADINANERDAIAAVLQRDPAYRALHDKAAAYYELARQQKAG